MELVAFSSSIASLWTLVSIFHEFGAGFWVVVLAIFTSNTMLAFTFNIKSTGWRCDVCLVWIF